MHGMARPLLRLEWRPLSALDDIAAPWADLAARAAESNIFYEPAFALPAARVFGRGVSAALIWAGGEPGRLVGFCPVRRTRLCAVGWTHPYAPLGVPLVDAEFLEPVLDAWLDGLSGRLLLLPYLPVRGPVASALARRAWRMRDFNPHRRALLEPGERGPAYVRWSLGAKRSKELTRQRRRLAEMGELVYAREGGLDEFVDLEAAGWKGRRRTAVACDDAIQAFVRHAFDGLSRRGQASVEVLRLDGRALAAALVLRSRATAYIWKIAYDESFSRYSPGVQLVLEATRTALGDAGLARADSCADSNHPMIDHIWRERLDLVDRLLAVRPHRGFALAVAHQTLARQARVRASALRDALRPVA